MGNDVKLFEGNRIRSIWNNEKEAWYFSIIDVVNVLTDSKNSRRYWSDLKRKMKEEEGADQLYENIVQLKLKAPDGKMRETDVADMQGLFRIIQSIPSPKAEPFKMWLAEVGKERVDETIDPELTIDRALETYLKKRVHKRMDQSKTAGDPGQKRTDRLLARPRCDRWKKIMELHY